MCRFRYITRYRTSWTTPIRTMRQLRTVGGMTRVLPDRCQRPRSSTPARGRPYLPGGYIDKPLMGLGWAGWRNPGGEGRACLPACHLVGFTHRVTARRFPLTPEARVAVPDTPFGRTLATSIGTDRWYLVVLQAFDRRLASSDRTTGSPAKEPRNPRSLNTRGCLSKQQKSPRQWPKSHRLNLRSSPHGRLVSLCPLAGRATSGRAHVRLTATHVRHRRDLSAACTPWKNTPART